MKKVLSIAGSDCSGGAGIQADLKTFSALGVFGMSVITSVVAENTSRVIDLQNISPDMIGKQMDAVFEDIEVDAVKVGMLSTPECMRKAAEKLAQYHPSNIVIDPVMYAKNGCPLMEPSAVETLIGTILPLADVLTPNIPEAERISGIRINSAADMKDAAEKIHAMGCRAVIIKGGHAAGNALDVLFDGRKMRSYEKNRINTKNTHGTGCTFSSAIAALLARGNDLQTAVQGAKDYVTMAIEHSLAIGKGCGPTHHFYQLYQCRVAERGQYRMKTDYSLYLVTDRSCMSTKTLAEAVEQALTGGCTMVQLREKEISSLEFYKLALEIRKITDRYCTPLIINDRADIAIAAGAAGVHMGQGDIPAEAVRRMIGKDMLLGVSVHSVSEAKEAEEAGADYLGVGAMFSTKTKPDAEFVSVEELKRIRQAIRLPIVVIGGICKENAALFGSMGIDGLAVVSAVMAQPDIRQAAAELKALFCGPEQERNIGNLKRK